MHPRVLRELADVATKPLSLVLKRHGSQCLVTGGMEKLCSFLKRVGRRTLGTTNLSASPSMPGKIMEQILLEAVLRHREDRKVI